MQYHYITSLHAVHLG
jgi:hypothetical protein